MKKGKSTGKKREKLESRETPIEQRETGPIEQRGKSRSSRGGNTGSRRESNTDRELPIEKG